jgi:catechol 2,3-dioxygenase-like lactoylglutathione lyase family enzyme
MGIMKLTLLSVASALLMLVPPSSASAQLTAAKDGPIVYGHHHLNVTSIDEHKKFWVDTLGGTPIKVGTSEIIKFPNVLVFLRQQAPTGGSKGTTVNHVGFWVPSTRAMVDKLKAAGYPIVTKAEVPPAQEVKDDLAYIADQDTFVAFTMGPDNMKVEIVEKKGQTIPITLHHIHFATQQVDAMKAWYVKTFNAKGGMRGAFQAADLPGVNLTYSASADPVVGTRGRTLDHIGFEVKDLEAFCKNLEAQGITLDRPYTKVAALNIAIAFFTDPFGTYIELTEGLDKF